MRYLFWLTVSEVLVHGASYIVSGAVVRKSFMVEVCVGTKLLNSWQSESRM
jgi:hypothetical protein